MKTQKKVKIFSANFKIFTDYLCVPNDFKLKVENKKFFIKSEKLKEFLFLKPNSD